MALLVLVAAAVGVASGHLAQQGVVDVVYGGNDRLVLMLANAKDARRVELRPIRREPPAPHCDYISQAATTDKTVSFKEDAFGPSPDSAGLRVTYIGGSRFFTHNAQGQYVIRDCQTDVDKFSQSVARHPHTNPCPVVASGRDKYVATTPGELFYAGPGRVVLYNQHLGQFHMLHVDADVLGSGAVFRQNIGTIFGGRMPFDGKASMVYVPTAEAEYMVVHLNAFEKVEVYTYDSTAKDDAALQASMVKVELSPSSELGVPSDWRVTTLGNGQVLVYDGRPERSGDYEVWELRTNKSNAGPVTHALSAVSRGSLWAGSLCAAQTTGRECAAQSECGWCPPTETCRQMLNHTHNCDLGRCVLPKVEAIQSIKGVKTLLPRVKSAAAHFTEDQLMKVEMPASLVANEEPALAKEDLMELANHPVFEAEEASVSQANNRHSARRPSELQKFYVPNEGDGNFAADCMNGKAVGGLGGCLEGSGLRAPDQMQHDKLQPALQLRGGDKTSMGDTHTPQTLLPHMQAYVDRPDYMEAGGDASRYRGPSEREVPMLTSLAMETPHAHSVDMEAPLAYDGSTADLRKSPMSYSVPNPKCEGDACTTETAKSRDSRMVDAMSRAGLPAGVREAGAPLPDAEVFVAGIDYQAVEEGGGAVGANPLNYASRRNQLMRANRQSSPLNPDLANHSPDVPDLEADNSKVQRLVTYLKTLPLDQLAAGFQAADANSNGGVSMEELKGIMDHLLPAAQLSEADLTAAVAMADLDKSGEVTLDELVKALKAAPAVPVPRDARTGPDVAKVQRLIARVRSTPRDQLAAFFRGNGGVSVMELKAIMAHSMPDVHFSEADLAMAIGHVDLNRDGEVSFDELMAVLDALPAASTPSSLPTDDESRGAVTADAVVNKVGLEAADANADVEVLAPMVPDTSPPDTLKVQRLITYMQSLGRDQLTAAFPVADANQNGRVSVAELKAIMAHVMPDANLSDADLTAAISIADLNKDGGVSLDEVFTTLVGMPDRSKPDMAKVGRLMTYLPNIPRTQLAAAWKFADKSGNGAVSMEELKAIMAHAMPEANLYDADLNAAIALVDLNMDGEVTFDELVASLDSLAQRPSDTMM